MATDEGFTVRASKVPSCDSQSSGVVQMLEQILGEFIVERSMFEKDEMESKQADEMLMQDLNAQLDQAKSDVKIKSETKAKALQAKSTGKDYVAVTTTTWDNIRKYLDDPAALCGQQVVACKSR